MEHTGTNDNNYISCIAVDDGERSWSFDVSGEAFAQLALGDTVAVRASPRSGKLLGLTPDQDRAGGATLLGHDQEGGATLPRQAGVAAVDAGPPAAPAESLPVATTAGEPIAATGQPGAVGTEPEAVGSEPGAVGSEPGAVGSEPEAVGSEPRAPSGAATAGDGAARCHRAPGWPGATGSGRAAAGRPAERRRGLRRGRGPSAAPASRPRAASVVYRGERITVLVTVADGFLGGLAALARRRGQPLAGVGDEAWLLNHGRTAVLLVGGLTAKVSAGGSATRSLPPDALARLAATVAERLPQHVTLPGQAGLGAGPSSGCRGSSAGRWLAWR